MTYVIGGYLHGSLRSVDHKDTRGFRAAQSRRVAHGARAAAAARACAGRRGVVAETGRSGRRQQGARTRVSVRECRVALGLRDRRWQRLEPLFDDRALRQGGGPPHRARVVQAADDGGDPRRRRGDHGGGAPGHARVEHRNAAVGRATHLARRASYWQRDATLDSRRRRRPPRGARALSRGARTQCAARDATRLHRRTTRHRRYGRGDRTRRLARQAAVLLERAGIERVPHSAIRVEVVNALGAGYGYPTTEGERARRLASDHGLRLEPTYGAKAFSVYFQK